MDISLILKITGIGILVSISCQILSKSGRDEQATLLSIAGIIIVACIIISELSSLLLLLSKVFNFWYEWNKNVWHNFMHSFNLHCFQKSKTRIFFFCKNYSFIFCCNIYTCNNSTYFVIYIWNIKGHPLVFVRTNPNQSIVNSVYSTNYSRYL